MGKGSHSEVSIGTNTDASTFQQVGGTDAEAVLTPWAATLPDKARGTGVVAVPTLADKAAAEEAEAAVVTIGAGPWGGALSPSTFSWMDA